MKRSINLILAFAMLFSMIMPVSAKSKTLYEAIAEQAVRDDIKSEFVESDKGIDFSEPWEYYGSYNYDHTIANGKGVYTIASTLKDKYPIHYYRGAVDNNHVLLEGNCYLIVRTTDTGGVKIMYDGKAGSDGTCVNTTFDPSLLKWYGFEDGSERGYMEEKGDSSFLDWSWDYSPEGNYVNTQAELEWNTFLSVESDSLRDYKNFLFADEVTFKDGKYYLENPESYQSMSKNELKNKYTCKNNEESCESIYHIEENFSDDDYWIPYTIYHNGDTYESTMAELEGKKLVLGHDVKYKNGKYTLLDTVTYPLENLDTVETVLTKEKNIGKRHYVCLSDDNTCKEVYYLYDLYAYSGGDTYVHYVLLRNGAMIETALAKLYKFYQKYINPANDIDSDRKSIVDTWYQKNLVPYTHLLEDTVWCNDRTTNFGNFDINTNFRFGYGYFVNESAFSTYQRLEEGKPTLECSRKADSFTVNNSQGNKKLKYPVGLLTSDEMMYMGTTHQSWCPGYAVTSMSSVSSRELYEQKLPFKDWTVSNDEESTINNSVAPISECKANSAVLPTVSLKNTEICAGTGTAEDPYRVGYSACGLEPPLILTDDTSMKTPNTYDDTMMMIMMLGISTLCIMGSIKLLKSLRSI